MENESEIVEPEVKVDDAKFLKDAARSHLRAAWKAMNNLERLGKLPGGSANLVLDAVRAVRGQDPRDADEDILFRMWWVADYTYTEGAENTPLAAAEEALDMQRREGSIATVFEVETADGLVKVDFDPGA